MPPRDSSYPFATRLTPSQATTYFLLCQRRNRLADERQLGVMQGSASVVETAPPPPPPATEAKAAPIEAEAAETEAGEAEATETEAGEAAPFEMSAAHAAQ